MRVTVSQLRKIVKEEVSRVVREAAYHPSDAASKECPFEEGEQVHPARAYRMGLGALRSELRSLLSYVAKAPKKKTDSLESYIGDRVVALACYTSSYDSVMNDLESLGLSPEESADLVGNNLPEDESYFYDVYAPWIKHVARGGRCEHRSGHLPNT